MKSSTRLQNTHGFTIAEVIMVAGIGSLIALAMANMMLQSMKAQKNFALSDDLQNLATLTKMTLSTSAVCGQNLGNFNKSSTDTPRTFDSANLTNASLLVTQLTRTVNGVITPFATNNAALPGRPNSLVTMKLQNIKEVSPNTQYTAELAFTLIKDNSNGTSRSIAGANQITKVVPINLTTSNGGAGTVQTILSCATYESATISATQINQIKADVCNSIPGASWSAANGTCTPSAAATCGALGGTWTNNTFCKVAGAVTADNANTTSTTAVAAAPTMPPGSCPAAAQTVYCTILYNGAASHSVSPISSPAGFPTQSYTSSVSFAFDYNNFVVGAYPVQFACTNGAWTYSCPVFSAPAPPPELG